MIPCFFSSSAIVPYSKHEVVPHRSSYGNGGINGTKGVYMNGGNHQKFHGNGHAVGAGMATVGQVWHSPKKIHKWMLHIVLL